MPGNGAFEDEGLDSLKHLPIDLQAALNRLSELNYKYYNEQALVFLNSRLKKLKNDYAVLLD